METLPLASAACRSFLRGGAAAMHQLAVPLLLRLRLRRLELPAAAAAAAALRPAGELPCRTDFEPNLRRG